MPGQLVQTPSPKTLAISLSKDLLTSTVPANDLMPEEKLLGPHVIEHHHLAINTIISFFFLMGTISLISALHLTYNDSI